jgi:hypothetical protein
MAEGMLSPTGGGGTSNRPDLTDPMGAPKFVTGPEVLDALGRVGFNINDPYGMSKMFDIAKEGTNLLTQVYNQRMAVDKQTADLGEIAAHTNYYQSEADFNDAALGWRVKDLEAQAKMRDAQTKEYLAQTDNRSKLADAQTKEYQAKADAQKQANDDYKKAWDNFDAFTKELQGLDSKDPNWQTNVNALYGKYPEIRRSPTAFQMAENEIGRLRAERATNSEVLKREDQRARLQTLAPYLHGQDIDQGVQNGLGQAMIGQGTINQAVERIQSVMGEARRQNRSDIVAAGAAEIANLQTYASPEQQRDQTNRPPPMLKSTGELNPYTESEIGRWEQELGMRASAAAAAPAKAAEQTDLYKIDPSTGKLKLEQSTVKHPVEETPPAAGVLTAAGQTTSPPPAAVTTAQAGQPKTAYDDPTFWQVYNDYTGGNLRDVPAGSLKSTDPATRQAAEAALEAHYFQAKAAEGKPVPGQAPTTGAAPGAAPSIFAGAAPGQAGGLDRTAATAQAYSRMGDAATNLARRGDEWTANPPTDPKTGRPRPMPAEMRNAMNQRERLIEQYTAPVKPPAKGRRGASALPQSSAGMSEEQVANLIADNATDPIWQQHVADASLGPNGEAAANPLPGGYSPFSAGGRRALVDRYLADKYALGTIPEGEAHALPATTPARPEQTIPHDIAQARQNQNAAAPVLVANNPASVDYHTFKFGNATTFGLNYDGTRDYEDNGIGFYHDPVTGRPYNTRDPALVGASVNKADLIAYFGNSVLEPDSAISRMISRGEIQVQIARADGGVVQMPMVDQGPAAWTGATMDLTMAASRLFHTQGKSALGYRFVDRFGNPFTMTLART